MKIKNSIPLFVVLLAVSFLSCSNFVENVRPLIDQVEGEELNEAGQVEFFLRGVKGHMYTFWDNRTSGPGTEVHGDAAYHDERWFNFFGAPRDLAFGSLEFDLYEPQFGLIQSMRALADEFIVRLPLMEATGEVSSALKEESLWWANFVGGYARMLLGVRWGLTIDGLKPGATISPDPDTGEEFGEFKTTNQLLAMALEKYTEALKHSPPGGGKDGIADAGHADRIIWSFIARTHLWNITGGMGGHENLVDADAVRTAAAKGLVDGDDPFLIVVGKGFSNPYWQWLGRSSIGLSTEGFAAAGLSWFIDPRFVRYVVDDPKEGEIIGTGILAALEANDKLGAAVLDPTDPVQPAFTDAGGFSLARFGSVKVDGVWTNLEGESGERGHPFAVNPRADVLNPKERIKLIEMQVGKLNTVPGRIYAFKYKLLPFLYFQDRYNQQEDDIALIEWQENELILAELDIYDENTQSALDHINTVRVSHNLDPKTMVEMENFSNPDGGAYETTGPLGLLIEERDKELFLKSTRLYDQFRFDLWHLDPPPALWVYWPIPQKEVEINPNISR